MKMAIRRARFALFLLAPLMCLVALSGIGESNTVHAQGDEGDYVDVAVVLQMPVYEPGRRLEIIVMNLGSRTAYEPLVLVSVRG